MRRSPLVAVLLVVLISIVSGCRKEVSPERREAMARLSDRRSAVRIAALRALSTGADRVESLAMARAASDAPEEVRVEAAKALGGAKAREAVDLLGTMLRDPSDQVRAEAVRSLRRHTDPKVEPYIVRAYATGGPRLRAAVAEGGEALLRRAVEAESRQRRERAELLAAENASVLRATALVELGAHGTAPAIAQLSARLVDDDAQVAAASAQGLALAGATDQVPLLAQAVRSLRPHVTEAAAEALSLLDPAESVRSSIDAIEKASVFQAMTLLDVISDAALDDTARMTLCARGLREPDIALASRLLSAAGAPCALPPPTELDDESWARWFALGAVIGQRDASALLKAREWLAHPNASHAAHAADYLGAAGDPQDAGRLDGAVRRELEALVDLRLSEARSRAERTARRDAELARRRQLLNDMIGDDDESSAAKIPAPVANKLAQMIARAKRDSEGGITEHRVGALAFIERAALAAVRRGADALSLGAALQSDPEPRIRLVASHVAELAGEQGEALRERLRADPDLELRTAVVVADLDAGRPGAVERAVALAELLPEELRIELLTALVDVPGVPASLWAGAARQGGLFAVLAARALGTVDAAEVDSLLGSLVVDVRGSAAYAATSALSQRTGEEPLRWLSRGAVHPNEQVRALALDALSKRGACAGNEALRALVHDFEGRVRRSAEHLVRQCGWTSALSK